MKPEMVRSDRLAVKLFFVWLGFLLVAIPSFIFLITDFRGQVEVNNAATRVEQLDLVTAGGATTGSIRSGVGSFLNNDLSIGTTLQVTGLATLTAGLAIALNMNTHLIDNVVDPVAAQDAATKHYVDGSTSGAVSGTTNFISKFTSAHVVGNSSATDDATTFAINTNKLTVTEATGATAIAGQCSLNNDAGQLILNGTAGESLAIKNNGQTIWDIDPLTANGTDAMTVRLFRHVSTSGAISMEFFGGGATGTHITGGSGNTANVFGGSWFRDSPGVGTMIGANATSTQPLTVGIQGSGWASMTSNLQMVLVDTLFAAGPSFDTTAGALTSYGIFSNSHTARAAGANTLTNVGLYGTASNAQVNYAGYFDAGAVLFNDAIILNNVILPTAIAANQNDYAPTGAATATYWALNPSNNVTITGISASQVGGRVITITNRSTSKMITFTNGDASSSNANRFDLPDSSSLFLCPQCSATFIYFATTSHWRTIDQAPAAAITEVGGHIFSNGTVPGIGSCGGAGAAITGTDFMGTVTIGAAGTGCIITFNVAFANAPTCVVTSRTTAAALVSYAPATGTLTLTGATAASVYDYVCGGSR